MSFISKLKSVFFKPEEQKPQMPQTQSVISSIAQETSIEACIICQQPILDSDRYKEINGNKAHKRCFKKAAKGLMAGKNVNEIMLNAQTETDLSDS